uniref:MYND-type zinc finger-containing chromatin reader ZMYND8-like isoform X3 n=1 Tax=Myxine glutinosa TaxID=7769 RepID=UPI00358DDCFD
MEGSLEKDAEKVKTKKSEEDRSKRMECSDGAEEVVAEMEKYSDIKEAENSDVHKDDAEVKVQVCPLPDAQPDKNLAITAPKKHKRLAHSAREQDGRNDCYCWLCHREGQVLCCELCPRVFHARCLRLPSEPEGDWFCPECEKVTMAECVETQSKAMGLLTADHLCYLLRLALQRMKHPGTEPFHQPVSQEQHPDYTEHVFHPMDLGTLEQNVMQKMYGCTEAFVADTKWILHNCIIFNGANHKLTAVAKSIIKVCEHEVNDIEACPECYLIACRQQDNWFCEPCSKPHPLVWAKVKGFPFWPARAVRERDGQVDVRFFGQHDRAWVPLNNCYFMSKEVPVSQKKTKGIFACAMAEMEICIERMRQKFKVFNYAPFRTPYTTDTDYQLQDLENPSGGSASTEKGDNWKLSFDMTESPKVRGTSASATRGTVSSSRKVRKGTRRLTTGSSPASSASSPFAPSDGESDDSIGDSVARQTPLGSSDDSESTADKHGKTNEATDKGNEQTLSLSSPSKEAKEIAVSTGAEQDMLEEGEVKEEASHSCSPVLPEQVVCRSHTVARDREEAKPRSIKREAEEDGASTEGRQPPKRLRTLKEKLLRPNVSPRRTGATQKVEAEESVVPVVQKTVRPAAGGEKVMSSMDAKPVVEQRSPVLESQLVESAVTTDSTYAVRCASVGSVAGGRRLLPLMPKEPPSTSGTVVSPVAIAMSNPSPSVVAVETLRSQAQNATVAGGPSADVASDIDKYANKIMEAIKVPMTELFNTISQTSSGNMLEQIRKLKCEIEKLQWLHLQEIAEMKHNLELTMAEMRQSMEQERERLVREVRRAAEVEKASAVDAAKRKQWCANCRREAIFYCCWNTSYCDYPCQQAHWPEHMKTCTQADCSLTSLDAHISAVSMSSGESEETEGVEVSGPEGQNEGVTKIGPVSEKHSRDCSEGSDQAEASTNCPVMVNTMPSTMAVTQPSAASTQAIKAS